MREETDNVVLAILVDRRATGKLNVVKKNSHSMWERREDLRPQAPDKIMIISSCWLSSLVVLIISSRLTVI